MAQTVIGFFDDAADAQKAVQTLTSSGFRMEDVDTRDNSRVITNDNVSHDHARHDSDDSGVTRFFKSLFGDNDDEADRYTRVANDSCCIVTVHAQTKDQAERAADILDNCGAVDVDERSRQYNAAGTSAASTGRDRAATGRDDIREGRSETTVPKMEERLNVGKRVSESSGGVRLRSRIVERPVEEQVRLREEHVHVERQPVDRPVTADDMRNFQDKDIEFRERKEVPVVNKEARVVEEVKLSKDVTERQETIRDTVRHTEVDIDKIDKRDEGRISDRDDRRSDVR